MLEDAQEYEILDNMARQSPPGPTGSGLASASGQTLTSGERSIPSRSGPLTSNPPSIFSAGPPVPPTLTVESPSSSSTSSRTLTALSRPSTNPGRRTTRFDGPLTEDESSAENPIPRAEKDADDPTTPLTHTRSYDRSREYTTLTTLSKLFAANFSPESSRQPSYTRSITALCPRPLINESASLPDHLYTRGLLEGRHSDISVCAFGRKYPLHRIILDRAPFFTTALSEPWIESTAKEITLHPDEIDPSITQNSFELALKRLYGCKVTEEEEEAEAVGLFATGCWLEMQGLVDSSIDAILRQMSPETLSPLVRLVTANYYGQSGERILSSAKSMLCRDGWEMPLRYWDGIPGDIIREIIGGDGFFVDSEWARWVLAKRILDRRLRQQAIEAGLLESGKRTDIRAPETIGLMAVRFDAVYRRNAITTGRQTPDSHAQWESLYTNPEVEPLLVLLDEGIHYVHLDFEQLQYIREARDAFGLPVMPEKVITNALWMQMELRQKVLNAQDQDLELGISKPAYEQNLTGSSSQALIEHSDSMKGKSTINSRNNGVSDDMESGSWDSNGRPRKFWIPSADCNIVMGGNAEPVVTTSNNVHRQASRLSASMQPEDAQWATDFVSSPTNATNPDGTARTTTHIPGRPASAGGSNAGQPKPISYTHFPPFRFAAEFPNPRLLKEKKRVYSRTVFYAGSLWNIYIQKVRSSKNAQLGVYLHRAKERETEEILAGTAGFSQGSVDERIGLLERQMLLRSERRRGRPMMSPHQDHSSMVAGEDDTSGSGGDLDSPQIIGSSSRPRRRPAVDHQPSYNSHQGLDYRNKASKADALFSTTGEESDDSSTLEPDLPDPSARRNRAGATLPPYVDARPTIKTYFKIYSPSKGGRLLSVYESAPDKFNFSQSWGWKSSTLMLDEGMGTSGPNTSPGLDGDEADGENDIEFQKSRQRSDGKLRFMVVIGNL
ncbi:hypothetical protein EJ05DRAFT_462522 [Pseudovirgaria hyperparasitica]|uniref:BTB domain-containing protein n=1 Tax=Pseudovirgaria hyperparasitica TaxID=470096 RepID=A0A6A6WEJ4_9PEZI|nr:uncharacterized protein EJ05DRAFT_462522 [Pseudovirgaria hyperparasitica]KAF2760454.1 hypothetical protein EJ05DRAFT_462522 [Pseudovirgaria hyperparasitica]